MKNNSIKKKITKPVKIALIAGAVLVLAGASVFAANNSVNGLSHSVVDVKPMSAQGQNSNAGDMKGIGIDAAKEAALAQVPGASEKDVIHAECDYEHNRPEYEIEIHYNGLEYEFEIDGNTGEIISHDIEKIDNDNDDKYDYDDDDMYDHDDYDDSYDHDDHDDYDKHREKNH